MEGCTRSFQCSICYNGIHRVTYSTAARRESTLGNLQQLDSRLNAANTRCSRLPCPQIRTCNGVDGVRGHVQPASAHSGRRRETRAAGSSDGRGQPHDDQAPHAPVPRQTPHTHRCDDVARCPARRGEIRYARRRRAAGQLPAARGLRPEAPPRGLRTRMPIQLRRRPHRARRQSQPPPSEPAQDARVSSTRCARAVRGCIPRPPRVPPEVHEHPASDARQLATPRCHRRETSVAHVHLPAQDEQREVLLAATKLVCRPRRAHHGSLFPGRRRVDAQVAEPDCDHDVSVLSLGGRDGCRCSGGRERERETCGELQLRRVCAVRTSQVPRSRRRRSRTSAGPDEVPAVGLIERGGKSNCICDGADD